MRWKIKFRTHEDFLEMVGFLQKQSIHAFTINKKRDRISIDELTPELIQEVRRLNSRLVEDYKYEPEYK